jgi:dipeptidyl-peptidase-4
MRSLLLTTCLHPLKVLQSYVKLGSNIVSTILFFYRFLQENLKYIDPDRTAIWGWSYGGYATGMALAKDKRNVFKCGISVAPVSDWTYYGKLWQDSLRYKTVATCS